MSSPSSMRNLVPGADEARARSAQSSKSELSDRLMSRLAAPRQLAGRSDGRTDERLRRVPISIAQQRLWLLDRLEPGRSTYNMAFEMELKGALDSTVLGRSLDEIRRRHEALRTTFETVSGEPMQRIHSAMAAPLPVVDLGGLSAARRVGDRLAKIEAARPFDLKRGPLQRAVLLLVSDRERVAKLLITFHHIIFDGWSTAIFFAELSEIYPAFLAGRSHTLEPVTLQYPDYACRQRRELTAERLAPQIEFWRQEIGEEPAVLELPTDRPRPAMMSQRGGLVSVDLPLELLEPARRLAGRCSTSLFFIFLGLFQVLLARWAGVKRVLVGTATANRPRSDQHGLIGFVVNTVVVAADIHGSHSVLRFIEQIGKRAVGVLNNQETPFERLVEELGGQRELSRTPLFQTVFTWESLRISVSNWRRGFFPESRKCIAVPPNGT